MRILNKLLIFILVFVTCASAEIVIEEEEVTTTTTNSITTEISSCEENNLVMKSIFEVIKDIVLSSVGEENIEEKLKLFQNNKEYLTEIGILVANVSVSDSEQLVIRNQLEEYRLLAYADAAISYEILSDDDVSLGGPLWEQYSITVNDLFALEERLSINLENYQCD